MTETKDKYSLWIVPGNETQDKLQGIIDGLASDFNAQSFMPHITLVAEVVATPYEYHALADKVKRLASLMSRFEITLDGFGYKDEIYRCLYMLARSPEFDEIYDATAAMFPQSAHQHFKAMPHLSLLYGTHSSEEKDQIIAAHPLEPMSYEVNELQLFHTNGSPETWQHKETFKFP